MPLVLALSAIVPALLLMWYFWARDAYPEPPRVVWTTFAIGVFSVLPVVLVELPIDAAFARVSNPWTAGLGGAFLGAAIPEEVAKFGILYVYCLRSGSFDEPMDGLVYGAAASMGFAAMENLLYVWDGGLGVALMRAATAVPSHAMNGAIMGYFLALYHFLPAKRGAYLFQALAIPIVLHGLYNFPLMTAELLADGNPANALAVGGPIAVLSVQLGFASVLLRRVRKVQRQQAGIAGAAPDYDFLHAYHTWEARIANLRGWFLVLFGGLLAWIATGAASAVVFGATRVGGWTPLLLVVCIAGAYLGLRQFQRGVAWLNREHH